MDVLAYSGYVHKCTDIHIPHMHRWAKGSCTFLLVCNNYCFLYIHIYTVGMFDKKGLEILFLGFIEYYE